MAHPYTIGIVGATGAVGRDLLELLVDRAFPAKEIRLYASARSKGKIISYKGVDYTVEETSEEIFDDLDIALFSAGSGITKEIGWKATERGCVVIDNSSAYRMDDRVPLVVPEINPDAALAHQGLIANPNCSTIVTLMGLYPLHLEFGVKRVFASTYQAVSGAGAAGMTELEDQTRAWAAGEAIPAHAAFAHQIFDNLIPHVDVFQDNGYTKEEMKMVFESRKIMDLASLPVSVTCVRVPVMRAHSISVKAEFEKPVDVARARAVIGAFDGTELVDDVDNNVYPMPLNYTKTINCGVGRVREDIALDNGLAFFVTGDQIWKGAALNAVQIAEVLLEKDAVTV